MVITLMATEETEWICVWVGHGGSCPQPDPLKELAHGTTLQHVDIDQVQRPHSTRWDAERQLLNGIQYSNQI